MTPRLTRRLSLGALPAVAALAIAFALSGAAPAQAAYGCAGRQIDSYPIDSVGVLKLYYSSATGENCAVTVAYNTSSSKRMTVVLWRCATKIDSRFCSPQESRKDAGKYSWYAGPVKVKARGHCVWAVGWIGSRHLIGSRHAASSGYRYGQEISHHCG
jgi:hypothetical protein